MCVELRDRRQLGKLLSLGGLLSRLLEGLLSKLSGKGCGGGVVSNTRVRVLVVSNLLLCLLCGVNLVLTTDVLTTDVLAPDVLATNVLARKLACKAS